MAEKMQLSPNFSDHTIEAIETLEKWNETLEREAPFFRGPQP